MSDPVITWVREPGDPTWLRYEGLTIAQACEEFARMRFRLLDLHQTIVHEIKVEAQRVHPEGLPVDTVWPLTVRRREVLTVEKMRGTMMDKKLYRPFANAAEFAPNRDRWLGRDDDRAGAWRHDGYDDEGIWAHGRQINYDELLSEYPFEDGTPCGMPTRAAGS